MFKPTAKNIFIVVFWPLMIAFSIFMFYQAHILATYTQTPINVISSTYIPQGTNSYYRIRATYNAKNGKTYPIIFTSPTSEYSLFVYYNPKNPTVYEVSSDWPAVLSVIPLGVAALVTFLVYSNLTLFPKSKKKG